MAKNRTEKQLVLFDWVDACLWGDEAVSHGHVEKQAKLLHGFVAGILITEDEESITVARDWFTRSNDYRGVAVYPKKLIGEIHRREIKEQA